MSLCTYLSIKEPGVVKRVWATHFFEFDTLGSKQLLCYASETKEALIETLVVCSFWDIPDRKNKMPFRFDVRVIRNSGQYEIVELACPSQEMKTEWLTCLSTAQGVNACGMQDHPRFKELCPPVSVEVLGRGYPKWTEGLPRSTIDNEMRLFHKKYIVGKLLGSGCTAKVREGFLQNFEGGKSFAVKMVSKKKVSGSIRIKNEINILLTTTHPHIIDLIEVFESLDEIYLIFERCRGGELYHHLSNFCLCEELTSSLAHNLLDAVKYLHDRHIIHRDIKPENILLVDKDHLTHVKLIDFGIARELDVKQKYKDQPAPPARFDQRSRDLAMSQCGTVEFEAPEVLGFILPQPGYDEAVDIWSVGVTLFVALGGSLPFPVGQLQDTSKPWDATCYTLDFPPARWDGVSNSAKHLLSQMLQVRDEMRQDGLGLYHCKRQGLGMSGVFMIFWQWELWRGSTHIWMDRCQLKTLTAPVMMCSCLQYVLSHVCLALPCFQFGLFCRSCVVCSNCAVSCVPFLQSVLSHVSRAVPCRVVSVSGGSFKESIGNSSSSAPMGSI